MTDTELRHAVLEELEWAPHIDASRVELGVSDGMVRLSGQVGTLAEKARATRTAWHVKGVRGVANEIEVLRPGAHLHSDAELTRRVGAVLSWNAQLPPGHVKGAVRDGTVTLTGEVDWQFQKNLAEDQVRELAGVTAIENRISIRPAAEVAEDIHEKIARAFARHTDLDATDITTEMDGSSVRLSGRVRTHHECRIAENAAWSARGVTAVENALRVEQSWAG